MGLSGLYRLGTHFLLFCAMQHGSWTDVEVAFPFCLLHSSVSERIRQTAHRGGRGKEKAGESAYSEFCHLDLGKEILTYTQEWFEIGFDTCAQSSPKDL